MSRLRKRQIEESFDLEPGLILVRRVTLDDRSTYAHRCPLDSFEQVCHAIEESSKVRKTIEKIVNDEDLPSSQAAVARAFLIERGLLESAPSRRFTFVQGASFEDAMVEFQGMR